MRILLLAAFALLILPDAPARAGGFSRCIAFAERGPEIVPTGLARAAGALASGEVEIEYVTHSTFRLRTPAGVVAATKKIGLKIPVVVRMEGTNMEEGHKILKDSRLNFIIGNGMKDGAKKAVQAIQ